ncbi:hypothetical protein K470DRAFT_254391 [Piedraia hortae CBS 480.64]|uniref:Uncharacterized protein n=1 Tax=Piedraia hortae CBS 480.64 TaxID=1314780 RepID=A0A6A7CA20_9PEZI|nr:hypothetical protein K470DRAFT_254391 [Piedraia hortae CBS 480.64]
MRTRPNLFNRLPLDLLPDILWNLDVRSVQSFRTALYADKQPNNEAVLRVLESRLSVARYLNLTFGDGAKLLDAMSKSFVYLSGLRATNFFVQTSSTQHDQDSSWNFYLPQQTQYVGRFMQSLSELGVEWTKPEEEFYNFITENRSGRMVVDAETYEHFIMNGAFIHAAMKYKLNIKLPRVHEEKEKYVLLLNRRTIRIASHEEWSGQELNRHVSSIIHGRLIRKGKPTAKICLFVGKTASPEKFRAPLGFTSSYAQAFISPCVACHLYGELASRGQGFIWDQPQPQLQDQERGNFRALPVSRSSTRLRHCGDNEATWLEFGTNANAPPEVTDFVNVAKRLAWCESKAKTVPFEISLIGAPKPAGGREV